MADHGRAADAGAALTAGAHLAAFFPEGVPEGVRLAEGPWAAPAFGPRRRAVGLLAAIGEDPVAAALARPAPAEAVARAAALQPLWPEPIDPRLLAATRWADPFHERASTAEDGLALLALWRREVAANRGIAAFLGMAGWKQAAIAAAFAQDGPPAVFARDEAEALAAARERAGGIAVWATRAAPALVDQCRAAGVPLHWVEDGFLRSVGLGVDFIPSASLAVDPLVPHYHAGEASTLERILAGGDFTPPLLARAAALRAAIVAGGVTKYNLRRPTAPLPATPGRRRILVVGQVEDDASIRLGAGRVRTNLALLEAVRREEPEAFIVFRPHPDVETGYRRGYVPRRTALRLADAVAAGGDIGRLFAEVDALHAITSLAGFEALLRGLEVTVWGRPFYAGWGLTRDREPLPRRGRTLPLDALVAGALILYPRYLDPVTMLPCGPELLLERLADPAGWAPASAARRAFLPWWRQQGWWLKQARRFGLWQR
ncbi:capsule biosynthesis protein [Belnapia sp. T18]|uniref:Capsule biosynthesis protein n=1 Tax=Belnapia arida TaxID=2804533 RepID=A0ABS1UCE6_9PROT|nr:capsule biosynthesis protein [Belnapia arida]MBL6080921.1 capsule biosynthesis protein [Belnapia arida]